MKQTRNQKFQNSIDLYFKHSVLFVWNRLDIEWTCELLTKNQRTEYHEYDLHIPFNVVRYTVDGYHDNTGHYHEPETRYRNQTLPHMTELKKDFNNYFYQYALIEDDLQMSYVNIQSVNRTVNEIILGIKVKYYKGHLPFPLEENASIKSIYFYNRIKDQDNLINDFNCDVYDMKYHIRKMNKQMDIYKEEKGKQLKQLERMTSIIMGLYKERGKYDECPVCYENMTETTFVMTNCCHSLCNDCHSKCVFCPICRDVYLDKPILMDNLDDLNMEDGEIFEHLEEHLEDGEIYEG